MQAKISPVEPWDLERLVNKGLGEFWSRSSAQDIVEKHPRAPKFGSDDEKLAAIKYIAETRTCPSEEEALCNKRTALIELGKQQKLRRRV